MSHGVQRQVPKPNNEKVATNNNTEHGEDFLSKRHEDVENAGLSATVVAGNYTVLETKDGLRLPSHQAPFSADSPAVVASLSSQSVCTS